MTIYETELTQFPASAGKLGKKPPQHWNSYNDGSQRKRGTAKVRSVNFVGASHFISKSSGRPERDFLTAIHCESSICDTNSSAKASF